MGQEIKQANNQPQKAHAQSVEVYRPKRWIPVLFVVALLAVGAAAVWFILWASRGFTDPTAALTFIMGSIISLFILLSTIATTCIYWGQRNIMLQQWRAMRAQLSVAENQAEWIQVQAQTATSQLGALNNQVGTMINQTDLMVLSLEETRKIAEQNAHAVEAMQGQLEAMKAQAKTMDQSLVFGTRAYLGIHSVNLDIASKRIFLHVENVGKVPAKDVIVAIEIKAEVPETKYRNFCSNPPQMRDWDQKRNERHLLIPFSDRLGRTKVFPGSLRVPIMIRLDDSPYMSDQQFSLITGGYAKFMMRGLITYSDGFNSGKKTEFAFRYFGKNNLWVPEVIEGPQMQTDPEKPDSNNKQIKTLPVNSIH